jgi:serine/threonine-protein kinase
MPKLIGTGKDINVPNLVGKSLVDAQKIILDQGFQLEDTRDVYDTIYPNGFVVGQKPLAGSVVKTGKKISLLVSKGEQIAVVPSVEQMTLDQGLRILTSLGFNPLVESLRSAMPFGRIIGIEPPAGSELSTRSRLKLYVSNGNTGIFLMPVVVGLPTNVAIDSINYNGLVVGEIQTLPSEEQKGFVIIQYPEDGMKVRTGDTVRLIVSGR